MSATASPTPVLPAGAAASLWGLVIANLLVAGLVLASDWGFQTVLVVYWAEAVLYGAWNVLRILLAFVAGEPLGERVGFSGAAARLGYGLAAAGFFIFKFGAFALGTGFLIFFLVPVAATGAAGGDEFRAVREGWESLGWTAGLAALALTLAHGLSFVQNFILRREYARARLPGLLFGPYPRLVGLYAVAFVAVMGNLWMPGAVDLPLLVLAVVLFKMLLDLIAHRRAR